MATSYALTAVDETAGGTAMSDDELVSYLQENADRAVGHYEGEISGEQAKALNYYYGKMDDLPAQEGRSSVVDMTVSITTDNFVANVIKPFVSSDETVRFEPRTQEDVEQADQATEYVNYVLHCDNAGFMILHDWAKDAGLQKLGVVKIWWEDQTDKRPQLIENMDAAQVEMLGEAIVDGPYIDGETGLFSAYVLGDYADGRVKIENIPPEEYLISPYARPGCTPPYEAHRTRKARSELLEMGFDPEVVDSLSKYAYEHEDQRSIARYQDESHDSTRSDAPGDRSRDLIEVYHEFVLIDYDGDGISELREIIRSDSTILYNEEVDHGPFAKFCPIPMPHKVYGRCPADLVVSDQRIKTALLRQQLDNMYLANNPRPVLPEGAERADGSTLDDLMDCTPGAAIREGRSEIRFEAVPFVADKVYPMQEYVDREIARKSGVAKNGQSLDRNALKTPQPATATQAVLDEESENMRLEMMARIFAETGVSDMFRIILKLLVKHQPRERMIRLRNKWVSMDPRAWNSDMDLSISVGLGVGNQTEQITQSNAVLGLMEKVAISPFAGLVTEENVFKALKRAFTALGIKNTDDFLTEPVPNVDPQTGEEMPREQPPSPEQQKVEAEAQLQAAKLQGEQQMSAAKIQLQREEAAAKLELAREEAAAEAQLAREKVALETELAVQRMEQEMVLAERRMQMEEQLAERKASIAEKQALSKNRPGGDLDK